METLEQNTFNSKMEPECMEQHKRRGIYPELKFSQLVNSQ